jgi:hypothetical protein
MSDRSVRLLLLCLLLLTFPSSAVAEPLFREEFNDLSGWKPYTFPKIPKHTDYSVIDADSTSVLRAESHGSASALIFEREFDVYAYPTLAWRWKVDSVYRRGNALTKAGDDYPMRVYVLFPYDPSTASALERVKYALARAVYGEYPPHSTLNYIWANRSHDRLIMPNAYTDRAMMVLLRQGESEVGKWVDEEVDILSDYRKAFGQDPPRMARLAVMNDSDDTGERSVSFLEYIQLSR